MKYLPIDSELFIQNRKRFTEQLKPNSVAVFNSNDLMPTSADGNHPFIQQTDLFYLSGIDQEESTAGYLSGCERMKNTGRSCFSRKPMNRSLYGKAINTAKEEATAVAGIKTRLLES